MRQLTISIAVLERIFDEVKTHQELDRQGRAKSHYSGLLWWDEKKELLLPATFIERAFGKAPTWREWVAAHPSKRWVCWYDKEWDHEDSECVYSIEWQIEKGEMTLHLTGDIQFDEDMNG